jgi:hypothetical protein
MSPGMHCPKQHGAPDVPHGTHVVPTHAVPAAHDGLHVGGPASPAASVIPPSGNDASGIPVIAESGMPIVESFMPAIESGVPVIVESPVPVIESDVPASVIATTAASGKSIAIIAAEGGATPASVLTLAGGAVAIIPPLAMPVTSVESAQKRIMLASTAQIRPCVLNKLQSASVVHKLRQR